MVTEMKSGFLHAEDELQSLSYLSSPSNESEHRLPLS